MGAPVGTTRVPHKASKGKFILIVQTPIFPSTNCLTAVNGNAKTLCACSGQIPAAYTPCGPGLAPDSGGMAAVSTYLCPMLTTCGILTPMVMHDPVG